MRFMLSSNYKYFTVHVRPVNLPKGGTVTLFDRKKLRNFRKDGHNWKKKKDGKTVKEAHEHLKASFIVSFSNNAPDPKRDSKAVQEFLGNMEAAFRAHSLWAGCSEEELESAGEVSTFFLFFLLVWVT
nr:calmodulin-binding transcription activator 5-like isoform X1 [Ipomoea batatas]